MQALEGLDQGVAGPAVERDPLLELLRMRAFEGPEEFLLSLRTAEVLRRPKSLAYLQSLKWVAQVKEKVR